MADERNVDQKGASGDSVSSEKEANQWAMFIHFSLLAGFALPIVGVILPIILWQLKKDEYTIVDVHGKIVVNWIISALIYLGISMILMMIAIGVLGILVISGATVVFAIVGGIKANNGEVWEYPLSLKLIN